ncbi:MAG: hypothetical protein VX640_14515 [Pseudomonadota bacterium]|nr:hypothetical protein [Pseudomonadota bacterium]
MRYLIGGVASALLIPLWYAMSGGAVPAFFHMSLFGVPFAVIFVLLEMAALTALCWMAMKVVAREEIGERSKANVAKGAEDGAAKE